MPKSVSFFSKNPPTSTLVHGNKAKLKRPSLALLRCKMTFEIFELGLISVQIEHLIFLPWPYCGANRTIKNLSIRKISRF